MHIFEKNNSKCDPKKKQKKFVDVFSSAEHEYSSAINQKSKGFRKKATNMNKYRQISTNTAFFSNVWISGR